MVVVVTEILKMLHLYGTYVLLATPVLYYNHVNYLLPDNSHETSSLI